MGLPKDQMGQRGWINHCGKGGAAQSFSYHERHHGEHLWSFKELNFTFAQHTSMSNSSLAGKKERPTYVMNKMLILTPTLLGLNFTDCSLHSLSTVHTCTLSHLPLPHPHPIHSSSTSVIATAQAWMGSSLPVCHPLFRGRSALKIHLCSSTSKERLRPLV